MRNQTRHLSIEQLADYVEGRLSPADARTAESHLATGCPTCQADLAWLRETLGLMASDDWTEPPATARTAVQRAYRQQYQPAAPASTLGQWLRGLFPRPVQVAMAFATALVLLVAGGLIFQGWRGGSVVQTATLTYVSELGEVQPAGSNAWKPASSGTIIRSGDRVRTSESSDAVLVFPDKSAIWLGAETDLSLAMLTYRRDDGRKVIALRQDMGETYNRIVSLPSPDSRFEIETPAAVITVRGTEFAVAVAASGITRVTVAHGLVAVTAQGITVEIQAGQATTVEPGQPPAPAVPAPTPVAPEMPGLPSEPTAVQTLEPRAATVAADQPASTEAPEPSATPAPTQTSRPAPVTQPTATRPPTETPEPTRAERPTRTPQPTETEEPTESPQPSKTREPTGVPEPTETEEPTRTPEPPKTAEPFSTPSPTRTEEATKTPEPTQTQEPSRTPEPTQTERPTRTPEPTRTQEPTRTSEPTRTERPTTIPEPTRTEEPTEVPDPTETEPAANSAGQAGLPAAAAPPQTPDARDSGPLTGGQGNDADLLRIAMLAATVAGMVLLQGPKK